MKKHLNLKVTGKVQNVGFRYHTRLMAEAMGLFGYVKNLYDGSVYIEVEGDANKVDMFVNWCRTGPPRSEVKNIDICDEKIKEYKKFKVIL